MAVLLGTRREDHLWNRAALLAVAEMPPLAALHALANASRDLRRHTAELPDSERGMLDVLAEYR